MRGIVRHCFFLSVVLFLAFFQSVVASVSDVPMVGIANSDASAGPMRLYIGLVALVGTVHKEAEVLLQDLKKKLSLEGRFAVDTQVRTQLPRRRSQITDLFKSGYDAALFVSFSGVGRPVDWRLYETDAGSMVKGRKVACASLEDSAAHIAVRVIEELMSETLPFLTHIAFVERKPARAGSVLRLGSFDGSRQRVVYDSPRILVSPVWGRSDKGSFVAISEFTPQNVRFIGVDLQGRRYRLLDDDGTYVGIYYVPDRQEVVYGRSGKIWRLSFCKERQLWEHRLVEGAVGTCGSPSVRNNGDVIYCSNGKICLYDEMNGVRIYTPKGYHVAPAYSPVTDAVLFSSRIDGRMQLQKLDLTSGVIKQLSQGRGNKTDPSWSPCGRYCAYCQQEGSSSTIWVMNIESGVAWQVSPSGIFAQFPSWSSYFRILDEVA